MRLLLDTHVVIWGLYEPEKLSLDAAKVLGRADVRLQMSAASLWEAAIKHAQGRLPQVSDTFPADVRRAGIEIVDVDAAQAWAVRDLPSRPHRDPFDRLLIMIGRTERIPLVTRDAFFADYGVSIIPA